MDAPVVARQTLAWLRASVARRCTGYNVLIPLRLGADSVTILRSGDASWLQRYVGSTWSD